MEKTDVVRFPADRTDVTKPPDVIDLCRRLTEIDPDIFHLHWPEWFIGPYITENQHLIGFLKQQRIPIVWTQHNFRPHSVSGDQHSSLLQNAYAEVYENWARAADGVVHLSQWGMREMQLSTPHFEDSKQIVIKHPHFGEIANATASLGGTVLPSEKRDLNTIQLGIVGAPRHQKLTEMAIRAFSNTNRSDLRLVVYSLKGTERVPDDERITAFRYTNIDRAEYDKRLRSLDALVMPFDSGMLATGTVSDAIAHGLPVIGSSWPYLLESLGNGIICYGANEEGLRQALNNLSLSDLEEARHGTERIRSEVEPRRIARQTEQFFELILSRHHEKNLGSIA